MTGAVPNHETGAADDGQQQDRRGPDRRRARTPRFSRYTWLGGRRRRVRRVEEREGSFVDVYEPSLLVAILWIALMNAGDSFFTLVHLQNGGTEVNPVAAALLETGRTGFVVLKSTVIAAALCVLVIHKNFQLARFGLWTAAAAYTLLFGYHLWLFTV
ncbi:MAG: hypothetical protein JNK02_10370 [Planctomycetes bacterium]|nr:hypothetical protein [Planctomycetota bacterium]